MAHQSFGAVFRFTFYGFTFYTRSYQLRTSVQLFPYTSRFCSIKTTSAATSRSPFPSERAKILDGGKRLWVLIAERLTPPLQRLA